MTASRKTTTAFATVVALLVVTVAYFVARQPVDAHHQPANKVAAAGSRVQVIGPGTGKLLLEETMKVSTPTDLLLSVTAECTILSQLVTSAALTGPVSEESTVRGQVRVWIEIDDTPVGVTTTPADLGKVVFCDRIHEQEITNNTPQGDDSFTLRDYQLTRNANGFNWISKNPTSYDVNGDNILVIKVFADFDLTVNGISQPPSAGASAVCTATNLEEPGNEVGDCVQGYVGARTLIVEPTKLTGHEQVSETDTDGGS